MSNTTEQSSSLSPTKLALQKIRDLKQQLAEADGQQNAGIAIVSMACRFPRQSSSPEAFWNQLSAGADEVGEVPPDRWDIDAYFDTDPEVQGRMYVRKGAFLDGIDHMDAEFFGISPREATWVDPQQRLLLEVSWEALERAGWPSDVVGRNTGVFVGWMHNDFQNECSDSLLNLNPYIATGSAGSFLCGRLSYQLGLQGPSLAVDTACSSSLVAIHLACQSLYRRECDRALVGGVNVMASPKTTVLTCKLKALSPGGNSRAFDARADGYVRGEGCGVVALRRLADAQRDGDPILAVIRGSAITHNGYSSGLTAPSPEAQERVIRECLNKAGIEPSRVDYLEAHGTGTELGDPIEMRAAATVLAEGRDPNNPLLVGSVKTNIGHLEAAAGIAGLIKAVLSLQHGCIPPHLHFEQPNPHIPWDQLPVKIVERMTEWPHAGVRVAGVSAFGMSGTNAHVVLESPTEPVTPQPANDQPAEQQQPRHHLLVLSGKANEAVQQLGGRLRDWLQQNPDADLADVCYTAGTGRRHFERRAALIVDSVEQAQTLLSQLETAASAPGIFLGATRSMPKVAWQFTGQGSQYVGMAHGLYQSQPVFRETLDRCDQLLRQWRERSLLDVMFHDEALLNQTTWTQPALFALEVGLAELFKSWGLRPDVVLGHSVGQFAAACVAGMISLEDGLHLITERSRLTGALPSGGAMAAIFAPVANIQQAIASHPDLSIAANNGSHTVISGLEESVLAAMATFSENKVRNKRLTTSHAFHSALMEPVLDEWKSIVETIEFRRAEIPLVCNISGQLLDAEQILDAEYWGRHLRQAVQFADSISTLAEFGCDVILELGPQPILTGMAASCGLRTIPALIPSLRKDQDNRESILAALAQLYVNGATPNFAALASQQCKRIKLPTYPFQRKRYWGPAKPQASQAERDSAHPLLGDKQQLAGVSDETRYENHLAPDKPRWLDDHKVFGDIVFPGAGYVEMGLAATAGKGVLQDVSFEMPLRLSKATCVQTIVRLTANQPSVIEIHSTPEQVGNWTRNFSANVSTTPPAKPDKINREEIAERCPRPIEVAEFYDSVGGLGLQYGPQFQTIREIRCGDGEVLVKLEIDGDALGYVIPPMLMDGAFQSLAVGLLQDADSSFYLPVGMDRLECFSPVSGEVWSHAQWRDSEGNVRSADLTLFDNDGMVLAQIDKLKLRPVRRAALRQLAGSGPERLIYALRWQTATLEGGSDEPSNWMIVRQATDDCNALAGAMSDRRQRCIDVQLCSAEEGGIDREPEFDGDVCKITASEPKQWSAMLQHYFPSEEDSRLEGLIWLAGTADSSLHETDLTAHTKLVCTGMLGLLHALRQNRMEQLSRGLQIITQDGVAIDETESVSPRVSQFFGLGRVVSAEYPGLRCRLVDVDDLRASTSAIVDFALNDSLENQFALRSGQAHVPRLVSAKAAPPQGEFSVNADGSYLITGGLGMLGRQAAKWLARRGARDVILVSRREPTDSTRDIISEIEQQGCRIHVLLADISQRDDVTELFARIKQDLPPLKGVIHASGVLDDGLMAEQTWSRFESVLAPKQTGALLLHEMTAEMDLDFFILYSSAASVLGSPGQGNYATANAFLDGLAQQRVAAGLPALSINWGPWTEGMAASATVVRSLALQGLTPLTSDESHQVMEQLIVSGMVQATVLDVDWRRMRQRLSAFALPVLDLVAPDVAKGSGDSVLVETLRSADEAEQTRLMTTHVQTELQQILSLAQPPELDTPLAELGLDSLMAVELSTRLQQQLEPEITISPTIAFDYPSPGALTEHLLSLLKELPEVIEPVSIKVNTQHDDVAIIGLGCRFPGAANAEEFWRNLCDGVDAIRELPADRWDADKYYSPTPASGKMYTREGGFLDAIGDFDAEFFGISEQEACWMDPQHRLLMEVSWEAMEDAGIAPNQSEECNVGVFMGIMSQDYAQLDVDDEVGIIDGFRGAGLSHSAGVGRLSFMFGFEGPSMAIDSASSSSLVAVCQAAKSLLESECNMALAGGVNAILTPTNSLLLCKAGMLSPDGRCKSFSAAADGFGRGEGCGVVVLKRRRDAERDGDRILAVIRGSAISHNGTSGGLTAPSGRSQERLIRRALENANVKAAEIDYLEAHGTGTELGDTIEMGAATTVLGQGRSKENPLLVGSVKANIGHLEAAGGISGLIKVVLSMQHGTIPRQLHFDEPSPHIAWNRIPIEIVTEQRSWPNGETRTASVSALGMSGTNAHVVLESGPDSRRQPNEEAEPRSHHLLVLSAKTPSRLASVAKRYGDWFEEAANVDLADACHTAAVGRRHWEHRAAVVLDSAEYATNQLRALERAQNSAGLIQGQARKSPHIAWLFTGEGSEYLGMGETLYQTEPVFRAAVDQYDQQLWQDREGSLVEAMFRDETLLTQTHWKQPALFVLQAALTKLWQSWGVEPDVVLGNGLGQYAAACVAGVMTWDDGLRLVAERSRVTGDQLQLAASPVASAAAVEFVAQSGSDHATLSSAALDEFEQLADTFDYLPTNRPLICNLSGDVVPVHRLLGGSYWRRHLSEPIRLAESIETLAKQDCELVLEIGPNSTFCKLAASQWPGAAPQFMPSLCEGEHETACMLNALGQLYVGGSMPNFAAYDQRSRRRKIQLPTCSFERKRYWITDVPMYVDKK